MGRMTLEESPEWMPEGSTCSMMEPTTVCFPSMLQSTSSSVGSSRKRSIRIGLPTSRLLPRTYGGIFPYGQPPSRGLRERNSGAQARDSRFSRRWQELLPRYGRCFFLWAFPHIYVRSSYIMGQSAALTAHLPEPSPATRVLSQGVAIPNENQASFG